jgi:hypothetical protein
MWIWLACKDPEPVSVASDCVVQQLGPEGGVLAADGVRVTLPPGALAQDSTLSLCPAEAPAGWSLTGAHLEAPAEVELDGEGVLFVPGADGQPRRHVGDGPQLYRSGTFFLAEDPRVQAPYEGFSQHDLLFVVDNSCSMVDDQQRLADAFPQVLGLLEEQLVDYHVGVTSTDLDGNYDGSKGRLKTVDGARWIDAATPDPLGVFEEMVVLGDDGSGTEKGLGAAYMAVQINEGTSNLGFFRYEAGLTIIVASDEPDLTPGNVVGQDEFIGWLEGLEDPRPSVAFHALVGMPDTAYERVAEAVGGEVQSLGAPSWEDFFEEALSDLGAYETLAPPAAGKPEAWLQQGEAEPSRLEDSQVFFHPELQVVWVERELGPDDRVWLLYLPR